MEGFCRKKGVTGGQSAKKREIIFRPGYLLGRKGVARVLIMQIASSSFRGWQVERPTSQITSLVSTRKFQTG